MQAITQTKEKAVINTQNKITRNIQFIQKQQIHQ